MSDKVNLTASMITLVVVMVKHFWFCVFYKIIPLSICQKTLNSWKYIVRQCGI